MNVGYLLEIPKIDRGCPRLYDLTVLRAGAWDGV